MPASTSRRSAVAAAAAAAALLLAWLLLFPRERGAPPRTEPRIAVERERGDGGGGSRILVHVAGAVRDPGVYRLRAGARVHEALARAGGATRRADLTQVNLAATAEDGRQVVVPERPRRGAPGATAGAATAPGVPLNLNTATLEQLDALDGIGPATAQQILDYREAHGGFGSVEELDRVPGIGEITMASLREKVRV